MRLINFMHFLFAFSISSGIFGQFANNNSFTVTGKILNRNTGIVVLYYTHPEIGNYVDSATLKNGEFKFSGKVNRVSDAHLWTDTSNHNFSDSSVVRFLLEPGNIFITYNKGNAIITGSKSQGEKENFNKEKSALHILKNQQQEELIDLAYIRQHKNSYLSGFLLSSYKRKLPMDTLQMYYNLLSNEVKASSEGKKVIEYIYPLTDDVGFRNKNPIHGSEYNKRLNEIKSVYDLSLIDTAGNKVSLKTFKGRYLLIDFWASWCQPCITNFPFMEELEKEYKSDSIEFISVSLDTDNNRWEEAIKKHQLIGWQLSDLHGFDGMLPVYCKVSNDIPQYVLIDKEGKIINHDTPQPMNPELKILIDKLFKKGI